jgi:hypothetical protein
MKINLKSELTSGLTSGLVSGFIISVIGLIMIPVAGNEMDLVLANRGLPPLSNIAMLYFCIIPFIYGIILVLLYSVLKDYFGAGIKTAILVSIVLWFMTYFLSNVSLVVYGFMPVKLTVIGTVWGLGELLLAGIIGSKLYKEVK